MRLIVAALAGLLLAVPSAAAPVHEQDPRVEFPPPGAATPAVPVIIVPGALGSRLTDTRTGREMWPGRTRKLLTSRYLELALRIDPETLEPVDDALVATGLFDAAAGKDFYRRIVTTLQQAGGYRRGRAGEPPEDGAIQFYEFAYDWRQDNVVTVRKLDVLIEQIRRDYGQPDLKVDVVAHSMGGLIVRYYERYGTADVLNRNYFPVSGAGARKLRRVVLLGTPNQGTVTAVRSFLDGYRVGLSRLPTEGVATMPAMYQLFPHPLVDWIVTPQGQPLERDVFDIGMWRSYQWSIFDPHVRRRMAQQNDAWAKPEVFERWFGKWLERARRFTWSLMVPAGGVPLVPPLILGGDCLPTPRRLVVEEIDGAAIARLAPEQIRYPVHGVDYEELMYEPGDGKVTRSSALGRQPMSVTVPKHEYGELEGGDATFDCRRHDLLTSDAGFLDRILDYLLRADTAGPAPAARPTYSQYSQSSPGSGA